MAEEEVKRADEEVKRVEKKKEKGWLENVPFGIKMAALIVIAILFWRLYTGAADIQQTLGLVGLVLLILYFLGTSNLTGGMLKPWEAVVLTKKEITERKHVWDIPDFSSYRILNCSSPMYIDGKPKFYQIGIEFHTIDGGIKWKISDVDCFTGVQGFYDSPVKPYGTRDEVGVGHAILPTFMKDSRKFPEILKFWK